jgi:hypothetical protein
MQHHMVLHRLVETARCKKKVGPRGASLTTGATIEYSNYNPTALNSYALSERRFSLGMRFNF